MLRYLFVFSCAALAATAASAAAVGDPCTGGPVAQGGFGLHCGDDGKLQFCDTQNSNVVAEQDCTFPDPSGANPAGAPNGVCGPQSCVNSDPATDACTTAGVTGQDTCLSGNNELCSGIAVWFDQDATNDQQLGIPGCQNDVACVTGPPEEHCDNSIPACTQSGVSCDGDKVVLCVFGGTGFQLPQPFALDCAGAFNTPGTCDPNATTGPIHDAVTAQGQDLTGQVVPDCNIPGGAGEGEGEGEGEGGGAGDHCAQDSECGRDQVCDNGTCKAASDAGQPPPGCSDAGTGTAAPLAGLLALIGLVPLFRRRRA